MQLRTGEEENRSEESKPGATSDRKRGNPVSVVRTWCNFGQEKRKSGQCSPNLVQLRTVEEENRSEESEPDATSDRRRRNPGRAV
ncbi:hypothetical protein NX023_01660 [Cytobacillus firmus]|nr:hypothetical protein [Cytobacillus firmus]